MATISYRKVGNTIGSIILTKNSKKACSMLQKLTDDPSDEPKTPAKVTANSKAHQLLVNGKPSHRLLLIPKPVK